jgi:hypothetical protein
MTPAPDGHLADVERPSRYGIAAKRDLEDKIVLAGPRSAFEAR